MQPTRFATSICAVGAMVWMCVGAVTSGAAEETVFELNQQLDVAASQPSQSMDEALERFYERARRAVELTPGNAAAHELLAILDVRRAVVHGTHDYLAEAHAHFVDAIAARPTSAYSWSNFATERYAVNCCLGGLRSCVRVVKARAEKSCRVRAR